MLLYTTKFMTNYNGFFPYEGKLTSGILYTYQEFPDLEGHWKSSFHFEEETQGIIMGITKHGVNFLDESNAYSDAVRQGFILRTTEGE